MKQALQKILIIYYSNIETSNTKKIALAIGNHINARVININEIQNIDIKQYNLVGFGSGIYFNKFSKSIRKFISSLDQYCQNCFVFYTSGAKECNHALNNFIDLLKLKQRHCLGSWHCLGRDVAFTFFKKNGGFNKKHPNESDVQSAIEFIDNLLKNIKS